MFTLYLVYSVGRVFLLHPFNGEHLRVFLSKIKLSYYKFWILLSGCKFIQNVQLSYFKFFSLIHLPSKYKIYNMTISCYLQNPAVVPVYVHPSGFSAPLQHVSVHSSAQPQSHCSSGPSTILFPQTWLTGAEV